MKKTNFLAMIMSMFDMRKGMDVSGSFNYMIGILVLIILAFTWFFPAINGENALNNSSTLIVGGTSYPWVVGLIVVLIVIAIVRKVWDSA